MTAAADSPAMVYLSEQAGHVIGMTLPLHPDIDKRWRGGELVRVNADGSAWQGDDEFSLPAGPSGPANSDSDHTPPAGSTSGSGSDPDVPGRPKRNAPRREWAAYATRIGALTEEDAELLSRDELIEATTPPEMKPPPPGED